MTSTRKKIVNKSFTIFVITLCTPLVNEPTSAINLEILSMGSIAYKIALVAKGQVDIALSFTKKSDWDLAAASLILEEAGGTISNIRNEKINYNTKKLNISSVLAANPNIHKRLLNEIKQT